MFAVSGALECSPLSHSNGRRAKRAEDDVCYPVLTLCPSGMEGIRDYYRLLFPFPSDMVDISPLLFPFSSVLFLFSLILFSFSLILFPFSLILFPFL